MAVLSGSARRRFGRVGPTILLIAASIYFILPLLSMVRFAMQRVQMADLGWHTLFTRWTFTTITDAFHDPGFGPTLTYSLKLAVGTVLGTLLLLLPTTLYVHLRVPRARSFVEFVTVLPYVVPPITMVAGVTAFFRPNAKWFFNSEYSLIPLYMVLALPFTFRALDAGIRAVDVRTLVDASRSLGAGWITTLFRALIPNLMSAIVSSSFLTAAVVLGEFTIANNLLRKTFPVFTLEFYEKSPLGGIALAVITLVGSTAVLGLLTLFVRQRSHRTRDKGVVSAVEAHL
jgi:putative spermidine/putrescine transport system permease protein